MKVFNFKLTPQATWNAFAGLCTEIAFALFIILLMFGLTLLLVRGVA